MNGISQVTTSWDTPLHGAIVDVDGTLYTFDSGNGSELEQAIIEQFVEFILTQERDIVHSKAEAIWNEAYNDPIGPSRFLGERYNISRTSVFNETWGSIDEQAIVTVNSEIVETLNQIREDVERLTLLTGAPRVWMEKVIQKLGIDSSIFDDTFAADDYDEKTEVFDSLIGEINTPSSSLLSIGDTFATEIDPARERGMRVYHVTQQSPFSGLSTFIKMKPIPLSNIA